MTSLPCSPRVVRSRRYEQSASREHDPAACAAVEGEPGWPGGPGRPGPFGVSRPGRGSVRGALRDALDQPGADRVKLGELVGSAG